MGVLTALSNVPVRNPEYTSSKAAVADTFYQGGLCFTLLHSGLSPVPATGAVLAGICAETKTTAVGDEVAIITGEKIGIPNAVASSAALGVGMLVYVDVSAVSDNPADLLVSGVGTLQTGDFSIGRVTDYNLDGKTWVELDQPTDVTRIA